MDPNKKDFDEKLRQRFSELPKVVQNAITSADVEKHLRELADTHKLHIDQWESLENEVMLALLGFQDANKLPENIKKEVGTDDATAAELGRNISAIVFEPIRQELERQLEHPSAVAAATTGAEEVRTKILAEAKAKDAAPVPAAPVPLAETPVPSVTAPAIPPPAVPDVAKQVQTTVAPMAPAVPSAPSPVQTVARAPLSSAYVASQPSHERKSIEGDPYREPVS